MKVTKTTFYYGKIKKETILPENNEEWSEANWNFFIKKQIRENKKSTSSILHLIKPNIEQLFIRFSIDNYIMYEMRQKWMLN